MFTIILFAAIGIGIVLYNEIRDGFFCFWDTLGFCIIGGIVGALAGLIISAALPKKYKTDRWSEELTSIQDNGAINGSFFLGSGNINGTMQYAFYIKRGDSYKMWTIEYYNAEIMYADTPPKIDIVSTHTSTSIWNKFAIGFFWPDKEEWTCVFNIPKGSIKNNFNLDAQ